MKRVNGQLQGRGAMHMSRRAIHVSFNTFKFVHLYDDRFAILAYDGFLMVDQNVLQKGVSEHDIGNVQIVLQTFDGDAFELKSIPEAAMFRIRNMDFSYATIASNDLDKSVSKFEFLEGIESDLSRNFDIQRRKEERWASGQELLTFNNYRVSNVKETVALILINRDYFVSWVSLYERFKEPHFKNFHFKDLQGQGAISLQTFITSIANDYMINKRRIFTPCEGFICITPILNPKPFQLKMYAAFGALCAVSIIKKIPLGLKLPRFMLKFLYYGAKFDLEDLYEVYPDYREYFHLLEINDNLEAHQIPFVAKVDFVDSKDRHMEIIPHGSYTILTNNNLEIYKHQFALWKLYVQVRSQMMEIRENFLSHLGGWMSYIEYKDLEILNQPISFASA
ncbi:hypothetical protein O9G_003363 [Rozella allomycis CSF55]|uniref:HECT domain-containing protein n=1 Tax=Rozella allomycis (strain CSF55) TaxID=988480 RepID=A0A075B047_ROZAC|nr:hypothetical protein O9G_003363 [Rozella allomycis CSF55]|eukprot:EPZ35745.1 hypothetical protein O9G_003363 [Rozella allomycis CSF55]